MNLFEKIAKENDNSSTLVNTGLGAMTLGGLGAGAYYNSRKGKEQTFADMHNREYNQFKEFAQNNFDRANRLEKDKKEEAKRMALSELNNNTNANKSNSYQEKYKSIRNSMKNDIQNISQNKAKQYKEWNNYKDKHNELQHKTESLKEDIDLAEKHQKYTPRQLAEQDFDKRMEDLGHPKWLMKKKR